jgi:adenylate cyclase
VTADHISKVDWDTASITGPHGTSTLRVQSAAVLRLLFDKQGTVVSKDKIMSSVWPGIAVTDDSLVQCVAEIRKALGDTNHLLVKTIPKRGYLLRGDALRSITHDVAPSAVMTVPDKSIAVLPFVNMSADSENNYFADGLTEDLITDLSNVQGFFVVARNSSFAYKGLSRDARQVARELGVKYILEGSARRYENRMRINVQLIDALAGGNHVWAERFDRELADVFLVQDEVTRRIVEAITGRIQAEYNVDKYRPANLEAYDLVVRSRNRSALSKSATLEAIADLERAIELDPCYPEAHRQLAHSQFRAWNSWGEPQNGLREEALKHALRATSLAPNNAQAHAIAAYLLMYERRMDEAGAQFEKAFRLNPNDSDALMFSLDYCIFRSRKQEAVDIGTRVLRQNPHPPSSYYWMFGYALVSNGQYEQAVIVLKHAATYRSASRRVLAAALALLGELEEARKEGLLFMAANPHWSIRSWIETQPFQDKADAEIWRAAYLLAGLPE